VLYFYKNIYYAFYIVLYSIHYIVVYNILLHYTCINVLRILYININKYIIRYIHFCLIQTQFETYFNIHEYTYIYIYVRVCVRSYSTLLQARDLKFLGKQGLGGGGE
jgi:hypothetical protein